MQGGTAVSRAAAPAASPVAFPAMSPIPVASHAALALSCAAATGTSHAFPDAPAVKSDEGPLPPRTTQQAMLSGHPGPSGLAVDAAAIMAMPEEVREPVQAPRRTRRQTMLRGQPEPPHQAPAPAAAIPAPELKPAPAASMAAHDLAAILATGMAVPVLAPAPGPPILVPAAAALTAMPEEAPAAAQLAAVEGKIVRAQIVPRRTRRQTMASGALVQLSANAGSGAATFPERRRRQPRAGVSAPCIAGATVADGGQDGAMPCISEEVGMETAVPAEPVRSPQVPKDSEAQLPAAGEPGPLGSLLCGGVQPGAAAVARRTRRQTMAALARPVDLGRSLLSSGACHSSINTLYLASIIICRDGGRGANYDPCT